MAESTLLVGNYNYSSWSLRPWVFVRFHDLPIEVVRVAFDSPEFEQALENSFSDHKVPVLRDGDIEVFDSLAILEYLAERYPATRGWPEEQDARALARSVSAEMHSSFGALRNELPMNCRRKFPGYRVSDRTRADIDRVESIWRCCRERYGQDGPWLFGEFSIADAMYAPVVMRFRSFELELDAVSRAYCDAVAAHPALLEWIELGRQESEVVAMDEIDWPGEPN